MKALLVAAAALLHLIVPGAGAQSNSITSDKQGICASLTLAFFPTDVMPGQGMDYDFDLANCGTVTERLTVRIEPAGPCRFIPRSEHTYVLEPGQGFIVSSLMIAPSCPGTYRLRGDVSLRGRTLDRASAAFSVHDPGT